MNIKRVNKIISEILEFEDEFNIQSYVANIVAYFNNKNSDELNKAREFIYESMEKSVISTYVNSDFKILKELEILGYFDLTIKNELENILNSQSHEIPTKLNNFRDKRSELITKIRNLKNSFDALNLEQYKIEEKEYQIIFSFPNEFHDLTKLSKATGDVDKFLEALGQGIGSSEFRIKSVDNGCIEFLISSAPELASRFVEVLDYVLRIKGAIDLALEIKKGYEKLIGNKNKQKEKDIDKDLEKKKEELISSLLEKISSKNDLNDEDTTRIKMLFLKMVKYFEEGVAAEVKTPYLEEPEEYEGDDKEKIKNFKEKLKAYKEKERIDEINKKIFLAQKDGFSLMLPEPEDEE